jgi:hypothetical protein
MTKLPQIPYKEKSTPSDGLLQINEGLDFILDHFDPNVLFPRTIMTKKLGYQRIVFSKQEALKFFIDSDFVDCRINGFPAIDNPVPDFIFIDLDRNFQGKVPLDKKLEITLSQIAKRLEGIPTVIWTGNGYHIYQPLECLVRFEDIKDFNEFENCTSQFLRFSKHFLSEDFADSLNNPSLRSCLLRVPNSINSKCITRGLAKDQTKVKLVNQWSYTRPSIGNLMGSFYAYLISEKIRSERRKDTVLYNIRYSNDKIQWIEKLLLTPLEDHRKYCIFHVLAPYLVNVKGLSGEKIFHILEAWLSKCNTVKSLDFDPSMEIKSRIKYVRNFKPMSLSKLRGNNVDLYRLLTIRNVLPNNDT